MTEIVLPANGWWPREYQLDAWTALERGIKRVALAWHRRAGKDELCLHWTACAAMQRIGPYWHMLPLANQARKAIWDAVNPRTGRRRIDDAFPREIRASTREQDMFIRFRNGSTWQVVGSDNYDSLVGSPPVGVVFSEYALADPNAWAMLRPILAENGGWALFISTPRGRNHFQRMIEYAMRAPDWFGQVLPASKTGAIPQSVIDTERRELVSERGEEEANAIIAQEYECSFDAAIPGAYYGATLHRMEQEGRIGTVEHDPSHVVGTAWDLGMGDSTAIWFYQVIDGQVHVIDYLEGSGVGLAWYANRLAGRTLYDEDGARRGDRDVVDIEGHAHRRAYRYGVHLLPHDADVSELGTGRRRVDILRSAFGMTCRVLPRAGVDDGIQAARKMMARTRFDASRCERGLDCLRSYQREWVDKNRAFRDRPRHDWTSHAADAFRYLAMGERDTAIPVPPEPDRIVPFTAQWLHATDRDITRPDRRYYR
jgi:hypothetical protein